MTNPITQGYNHIPHFSQIELLSFIGYISYIVQYILCIYPIKLTHSMDDLMSAGLCHESSC